MTNSGTLAGSFASPFPAALASSAPDLNPIHRAGLFLLSISFFFVHSRIFDSFLVSLHLTAVALWLTIAAGVLSGAVLRPLPHRLTIAVVLFYAWLAAAVPFSVWKGGSVEVVKEAIKALPVFLLVAGLSVSFAHVRRLYHVFAYAVLALALSTFFIGTSLDGRLSLDRGRYANPNDLAQIMLIAVPFWWFITANPTLSRVRRVFALAAMGVIFVVMARTGSRGGFIALLALGFVFFWRSSVTGKVRILLAAALIAVLAVAFLPDHLRQRYLTFFSAETPESVDQAEYNTAAIESSYSRLALFWESIYFTLEHPLFGVGPGMFPVAQNDLAASRGQRGAWKVTHNTFTQVSSEAGLPALVFYLVVLFLCFRIANRVRKSPELRAHPELQQISFAALALQLAMVGYVVSSAFGSVAYTSLLPTLAAFAVALERSAAYELARARTSAQPVNGTGRPAPPAPATAAAPPIPAPLTAKTRFRYHKSQSTPASR